MLCDVVLCMYYAAFMQCLCTDMTAFRNLVVWYIYSIVGFYAAFTQHVHRDTAALKQNITSPYFIFCLLSIVCSILISLQQRVCSI